MAKNKGIVLLHISPSKNYRGIVKKGLLCGLKNSGYGKRPKHKALYFYHENNINVIYDMVNVFQSFDVWEIHLTEDDMANLGPDEDSRKKTWKQSIEAFGTVAYHKDLPKKQVKFLMRVTNKP